MNTFTDGVVVGAWSVVAVIVIGFFIKEWLAHRREIRKVEQEAERLRFKYLEDRILLLERKK